MATPPDQWLSARYSRSMRSDRCRGYRPIAPGALIIFGGDTAGATLAALGCHIAYPAGELLPGVPLSRIEHRGQPLLLVTKAGGFGDETTLCRILDELRRVA